MPNVQEYRTLARALTAALLRMGVSTAVFEPSELTLPVKYNLRCRRQSDGSVAVILEPAE